MKIDIEHLRGWIGRDEVRVETLSPLPANALAATLDREDELYQEGDALPPLWHWLYFLPRVPTRDIGPDGHPNRGGFLPPVPLERRMWAGSRLRFEQPLRLGMEVEKRSRVVGVEHKPGRSGDLVLVTLEHRYASAAGEAIHEAQDIVYRAAPQPGAPQSGGTPGEEGGAFTREITPDPVLLFRYSALTFNAHRIHYDLPYASEVEGYPGLVVHGPLLATLLLDTLRRAHPARAVRHFSFRALAPLFHTAPFRLYAQLEAADEAALWARRVDGTLTMQARANLA